LKFQKTSKIIPRALFGERTMPLNVRQIINENTAKKLILLAIEDITGGNLSRICSIILHFSIMKNFSLPLIWMKR